MPRPPLLLALLLVGASLASTPFSRAQVQEERVLEPAPVVPASPAASLEPPASPPAPPPLAAPLAAPLSTESPRPLRPTLDLKGERPASQPRRFDQSLDELVRDGVVTPAERDRVQAAGALRPGANLPNHRQACRSGALSEQECRTGVSVRWRGRIPGLVDDAQAGELAIAAGLGRLGSDGMPLPPITVPVSALLSGVGGSFRLTDVFRVTPRPAPLLGNGNRGLLFPLMGSAVTTSGFGWRLHPVLGSWLMHAGKDLAAPEGTPVVAALSGRVVSSGLAGGYGLAVEIEHQRPLRRTLYGHLSELYVQEGEMVSQGTVIGRVGSTGLSTGPHLHFELRLPENGGWVAVDPGQFDPGRQGIGGPDAIALLMGQLLQSLERPTPQTSAG